jgi:hypothetical protein
MEASAPAEGPTPVILAAASEPPSTTAALAGTDAVQDCQFILGFAVLRYVLGAKTVGLCLEDQTVGPNGNAEQRTTGGMLVWRKADNWTAFTDGHRTWINDRRGWSTG